MRRRAIRALGCAVGLVAASGAPAVADPTNGQLAAVVDERLVTLNANGTGLRTLPLAELQITELAWSPDGNRLAFVHGGRVSVVSLATGRAVGVSGGPGDANPGWSADGARIAFRRGLTTWTVLAAGGTPPQPHSLVLPPGVDAIAWAPDLSRAAAVIGGLLALPGVPAPPAVTGVPAFAPDGLRIAFAFAGAAGLATIPAGGGDVVAVTGGPAASPRWSPDARSLVYPAGAQLRTVPSGGGAPRTILAATRVAAADWQPCLAGLTVSCESARPPQCTTLAATVTTPSDESVELPPAPCTDPAGRPLTIRVVKAPERGTLDGWRYTPAAGFAGQDTMNYRVSNGAIESELVRVTILVVRRPPLAPPPAVRPPAPLLRAPFLTALAPPRLDRRRRTLVRLSCDHACSFTIRLTARLRSSRRILDGTRVKRSLVARGELTLRLRLPSKPRGRLTTAWIVGRVRDAAGHVRSVKLPVRLPR